MGRKRKGLKNGSWKSNSKTNNLNEAKPENTEDSAANTQDDSEDGTQRLSLEEAEEKNRSDHDMSPKEKEEKSMEALGENSGNVNDNHGGGKKPLETPRPRIVETQEPKLSETETPDGRKESDTAQCRLDVCEEDNTERRNTDLENVVNGGTESNNDQSTSEEGKSSQAETTTKSDDANKIETTVSSSAKSDDDPSQQSFPSLETKYDNIDTEGKQHDHSTMKREEGKQDKHNHVDRIESQPEHKLVNTDADQQNGEDGNTGRRTIDLENIVTAVTQSNNDQGTTEEDQPIQMERTIESNGVNGEKTAIDVSSSQSFQTGDIKHGHIDGAEEQPQHKHVDGAEKQPQHGHMDMDVNQQSFQTGDIKHGHIDRAEDQPQHKHVDGAEKQPQHGHMDMDVDGAEKQPQHGHMDMDVDQQNGQVDNDSTSTGTDDNKYETVSSQSSDNGTDRGTDETPSSNASLIPRNQSKRVFEKATSTESNDLVSEDVVSEETAVASDSKSEDESPSQSVQNEDIEHDNINSEDMQRSVLPTTNGSPDTSITSTFEQGQASGAFSDDVGDAGLRNGEAENDNIVDADNFENEMDSLQSPTSGTDMAQYQGSDETHNSLSDIQNQSRDVSEKNTSAESNDLVRQNVMSEETAVATDAKSGDDRPSQSVQNENIEHGNVDNGEIQRFGSPTNDSPNTSITSTFEQGQPSGTFGDDVDDPGLRNGEISLNENEAENEMDFPQSPESGTDMAQYEGSNETQSYNFLTDIQSKTSQEQEIEKLQRELNITNENLVTLQEEINRRDEIINEKNSENAGLLQRCVALETSTEAADNLREQCEDKNHQIETLEGDLASARDEIESYKMHLEENENVAADHQRLIDENKSLNESLEQKRQASSELNKEVQALKEQITNHEDVVNDLKREIKKAIQEKEILEAKLVSRNETNFDLLSNCLKMEKKGEEMAAELRKMQQNYQDEARLSEDLSGQLRLKSEELTTTENKHKQEIEELKAKYKNEKDQAEKDIELLKNNVKKFTEGFQHLQAENKRIKDDLQTKSMECGNLKSERLRITRELDVAKKEISELNNVKDKLTADITAVNAEIMQLKAALEFKEAEKTFANECMQKAVREQQEMMYSMGNLQRIELENDRLKNQNRYLLEQNTKLQASLQEYGLLRDHIQEYYKALQDSQMELQREKEKSRHINEQLSRTGYRLDSMVLEQQNYRAMAESYRRSLEEGKEKVNKLERELDRLTIVNENLTEDRDKCEQKSSEYREKCKSLREDLEKSQAECREQLSQTQEGASDGTTNLLQENYFTSTPMGNGFQNPSSQTSFLFGMGKDKLNRKK